MSPGRSNEAGSTGRAMPAPDRRPRHGPTAGVILQPQREEQLPLQWHTPPPPCKPVPRGATNSWQVDVRRQVLRPRSRRYPRGERVRRGSPSACPPVAPSTILGPPPRNRAARPSRAASSRARCFSHATAARHDLHRRAQGGGGPTPPRNTAPAPGSKASLPPQPTPPPHPPPRIAHGGHPPPARDPVHGQSVQQLVRQQQVRRIGLLLQRGKPGDATHPSAQPLLLRHARRCERLDQAITHCSAAGHGGRFIPPVRRTQDTLPPAPPVPAPASATMNGWGRSSRSHTSAIRRQSSAPKAG